ncbi:MAG: helix-turn-helix domain-containing protein [Candidatus Aminicenantes bacterium]|nr:helix-turn-helix domain-containing protein [Candidatus Aminicenantes bacterium]
MIKVTEAHRWLTPAQAADFFQISQKTLYSLASRKRLPEGSVLRLGRALRFNLERIEPFFDFAKYRHHKEEGR